jgi:hypothetical protein
MTKPRFGHAATLLDNGCVLICGGFIEIKDGWLIVGETAELYDPVAETFSSIVANDYRGWTQAVTLSTGRALVMGGGGRASTTGMPSDLAELFDPATNRFEATAHGVAAERVFGAAAAALPDGRIVITGGQTDLRAGSSGNVAGPVLASAEVYTMSTIRSTRTPGDMSAARRFHTATPLLDPAATPAKAAWHGKILIAGGENADGASKSCDLFNPATLAFTATSPMRVGRYGHTATWLPDGRILVTGGGRTDAPLPTAEIYSPASGTWTDTVNTMSLGRTQHVAVLIPPLASVPAALRGKVLVMGGNSMDDTTAEVYNPTTDRFTPLTDAGFGLASPAMNAGRRSFAAVPRTYSLGLARFANGSATVTGFGTRWNDAAIPAHRRPAQGDLIRCDADGTFYEIAAPPGGDLDGAGPEDASLTLTSAFQGSSTIGYQAYTVFKAEIFVAGGEGELVTTEMFLPASGFNPARPLNDPDTSIMGRFSLTMDAVGDGRILLAGGFASIGNGQLFVPDSSLSPFGSFYNNAGVAALNFDANGRYIYHYSARPPNGHVLVFRGHSAQILLPD